MPFRRLAAAAATLCLAGAAAAAPEPPLKPGLWLLELQPDDPAAASQLRALQARLKDAPPQLRALAESMLQQQGVSLAGTSSVRLCLSTADVAGGGQGPLRSGSCSTTLAPGGSGPRFHTSCSGPVASETEGELRFLDAQHYAVSATTTATTGRGSRTLHASGSAQWLGPDCAGLAR